MAKYWKTALRLGLMTLAGLVVGINIYLWNAQSLMGNALPMPFGYGAAVVLTGSMEPTIHQDDLIFVKAEEAYAEDQIVVYQSGNMVVVHRLLSIDGETAVTQGDANNIPDDPIPLTSIKGRVIGRIPRCGPIVRAVKSPVGTFVLVALALLLPEIGFRREKQKDEDELEKIKDEIRRLKAEQEAQ